MLINGPRFEQESVYGIGLGLTGARNSPCLNRRWGPYTDHSLLDQRASGIVASWHQPIATNSGPGGETSYR
jgi:hypothetical protein